MLVVGCISKDYVYPNITENGGASLVQINRGSRVTAPDSVRANTLMVKKIM